MLSLKGCVIMRGCIIMKGVCRHDRVCHHERGVYPHEWVAITVQLVCDLYMLTSSGHLCSEIFTGWGLMSFFLT